MTYTPKRNLTSTADIQSFAVSDGPVLVPFVHSLLAMQQWSDDMENKTYDSKNNMMFCMPKPQYDEMRRLEILDPTPDEPGDIERYGVTKGVLRSIYLKRYLVNVEIISNQPVSENKDGLRGMMVKLIGDRENPLQGQLIYADRESKVRHLSVPQGVGKGEQEKDLPSEIQPTNDTQNLLNDRDRFLREFNRALFENENIDAATKGPYYKKADETVFFSHQNHFYVKPDTQEIGFHLRKTEEPRMHYNNVAGVFSDKSRIRRRGGPITVYDKEGKSDNPNAEYGGPPTFFNPIAKFVTGPMAAFDEEMPSIMRIAGTLGVA